ncbi:MAG: phenylalanine--tRNA ligase subunit alpha [Nanoarchaeota archaeon]
MVYLKKVNIKGHEYWYLFHTVRSDDKFLKKSKYLGKNLPKDIEKIKLEFLNEITNTKKTREEKIIESLTSLERKIFPILKQENELNRISNVLKLQPIEVLRTLGWLENKNLITTSKEENELIEIDKNGETYLRKGLPEKQFLNLLPSNLENLKKYLSQDEINISIGKLKKQNAINFGKEITITEKGKKILKEKSKEELFLRKLPLNINKLSNEDKIIYEELKKRRDLIKDDIKKTIKVNLTQLGEQLVNHKLKNNLVESLTPEIFKNEKWKTKTFRRYDLQAQLPKIYQGRKHFVTEAIEKGKKIWLEMGFKEMTGNKTVTSFWNFDALFTAQDHPVRELQDTFFMKDVKGRLPSKELVERVKKAHENGVDNSLGWRYKWNEETAKKVLIRTHTTCLSSQTLAKLKKENIPAKFFSIGKCFRNETVDWKHGFEFNQTEGIVVDPNANLRNLIGYLKEFAKKMGYDKIKVQPSYFPYTEPSVEGYVWNEQKKQWMEVLAAGIFRPEVTIPLLGTNIPVLAWGPGFDRLMMAAYEILDLREVYANDLKKLRTRKNWI